MGCCYSIAANSTSGSSAPIATVIVLDGSLREYSLPITVSKVLGIDRLTCFLCDSDSLMFDSLIPQLHPDEFVRQDQIYFVLPKSKLGFPLVGADMAAMAVSATSGMMTMASEKKVNKRRRRNVSVAPVVGGNCRNATTTTVKDKKLRSNIGKGLTWGKALRRSLRRSLSMINEEVVSAEFLSEGGI